MANQHLGSFTFVLHSHLPYVLAHGKWPHGMDWLCEAASETYIPLIDTFHDLVSEGISPKVTLGMTPVLTEQIADTSFKDELRHYLQTRIEAAEQNHQEFEAEGERHLAYLATYWRDYYAGVLDRFDNRYNRDLIAELRKLQDAGHIEVITSAATHGYIPLLSQDTSIQAQVKAGVHSYKQHYGRQPRGFWLPECAYRPRYTWAPAVQPEGREIEPVKRKGAEEFLAENGIEYFIIDSHLLKGGQAIGVYVDRFEALKQLWGQFQREFLPENFERSPYQAYLVNSSGEPKDPVAIFIRDPETGIQVWSGEHGYPGDGNYLEFHKKHFPGGLRYWRVTSSTAGLGEKHQYEPWKAMERVPEQAGHFVWLVKEVLRKQKREGAPPILCAPYDTELFGHWWFEGPRWLYQVLKWMHQDPEINLQTCSEYLDDNPPTTVVSLPEGSWGEGGFHWIWLNEWTEWTWKYVYRCELVMQELVNAYGSRPEMREILKQLSRELLLLESSDWQFLISTWSARDYAEMRAAEHYESFLRLAQMARNMADGIAISEPDKAFLLNCQTRDALFPDIDPEWFARLDYPVNPD